MAVQLPKLVWKKLVPTPDPKYGKPCTRSSLGISYIPPTDKCPTTSRLIIHGGETVARTPLDETQATWSCDFNSNDNGTTTNASWRLISSSSSSSSSAPPPRVAHAQAYHQPSNSIYIFGGRAGITMQEQAMNDVWKLDCSNKIEKETWTSVETKGEQPEPRSFHKMICLHDSLYVFGGCGQSSGRLADMYRLDLSTYTWYNCGPSTTLRGRGGANLLVLDSGKYLGVIAGFAGEETNDGQLFNVATGTWCNDDDDETLNKSLQQGLRPRSVCVSGSFPSVGVSVIFGGEVDPSTKGHEGAGSFDNSLVLLEETTGMYIETIPGKKEDDDDDTSWPTNRGWSDGTSVDHGNGTGTLYLFGGLTGDDTNPVRLDDLWELTVSKA